MPDIFIAPKKQSPQMRHPDAAGKTEDGTQKTDSRKTDKTDNLSSVKSLFRHPKHSMFPLASFAMDPEGVAFATQGESEEVHLFLRKHFITNLPWILFAGILVVAPVFFPFFINTLPFVSLLSQNAQLVLLLFYYVVVFGTVVLTSFINWYFNVYIVTNQRVVDVDFVNILYREVSSTRLNLIQDVTVKTGGVFRAIFDYGDVFIQTAGTEANFDFHAVPRPQEVAREIEKLMEQSRKKEGISELEEAIRR